MSIKKKFAVFNSIIQRFQQLLVKCSYHNNEMFTIKLTITKDIMVLAITHWNRWFKYFIPKQAIQRATYFSRKNVYTVLRIILLISSLLHICNFYCQHSNKFKHNNGYICRWWSHIVKLYWHTLTLRSCFLHSFKHGTGVSAS